MAGRRLGVAGSTAEFVGRLFECSAQHFSRMSLGDSWSSSAGSRKVPKKTDQESHGGWETCRSVGDAPRASRGLKGK